MSSKELYRRFLSLCKKWPKDESKPGRDYGEFFRLQIVANFPHGDLGEVKNPKLVEESLTSLEQIANNDYYNENPLKRSSASGLEAWACKDAISNDGIKLINERGDEEGLIARLRETLNLKFVTSGVTISNDDKNAATAPGKKGKML